ncbi:hypothetical protein LC55x_5259 [Lysobacter capsici]|uniref:hypothetical protein n=1 Tax=Lysobacter capsici TaxID=435897 RepID=UPI0007202E0A|nr:hypothetical protein [Lysobacter capsici]ALN88505.1 hypothetical protein LC55x_5259 [Lysobacter capsici]
MAVALKRLSVNGPGLAPAVVSFNCDRTLIRGPSDTGKSHIWDCIWFLLGGKTPPEQFPLSSGYDSLELVFVHDQHEYIVRKAMAGGAAAVFGRLTENSSANGAPNPLERVEQDLGELLVQLSGAAGKQVLRNRSEKGPVTGDDLRHWALLSQPGMISKDATSGKGFGATKRVSSFSLFLTGLDDSAVELYRSKSHKEQAEGKLAIVESELARQLSSIPSGVDRATAVSEFARVDERLDIFATQHQSRSSRLKGLRQQIFTEGEALGAAKRALISTTSIRERFVLLDKKYLSDLARLGATDEGIAFFEVLSESSCPLCGTTVDGQVAQADLDPRAPKKYREAIAAEIEKIRELRRGLLQSLNHEQMRIDRGTSEVQRLTTSLKNLEELEAHNLQAAALDFVEDPRDLVESHTRLSSLLAAFDEVGRLSREIERLKAEKKQKKTNLVRNAGTDGDEVGKIALEMLVEWGFSTIESVYVDAGVCDLMIDGRRRLSYGAGKRGLFLAALTIALMRHALKEGHPHLGVVVLDSPMKAYAQKESTDTDRDIPVATVNTSFYSWLSRWNGPGQIIVLENEPVGPIIAAVLKPIEFTDSSTNGRQGFYPLRK